MALLRENATEGIRDTKWLNWNKAHRRDYATENNSF